MEIFVDHMAWERVRNKLGKGGEVVPRALGVERNNEKRQPRKYFSAKINLFRAPP